MITFLHLAYRGGCPHLLLYTIGTRALIMEMPISKERAKVAMAGGAELHPDSPKILK